MSLRQGSLKEKQSQRMKARADKRSSKIQIHSINEKSGKPFKGKTAPVLYSLGGKTYQKVWNHGFSEKSGRNIASGMVSSGWNTILVIGNDNKHYIFRQIRS